MKHNFLKGLIKESARASFDEFDFTKSASANSFPYYNKSGVHQFDTGEALPVNVDHTSDWHHIEVHDENKLKRQFTFKKMKPMLFFLTEVLEKVEEINHHPIIVIDHNKITVTLMTNSLNDITELDLNLAKYIDEIYDDVKYIEIL